MSAYLLNLIFAHPGNASSATGIFNDYNASDPVGAQSKAWYEISTTWPNTVPSGPGLINQEAALAVWGQSKAPVPDKPAPGPGFTCDLDDSVYIRVASDSSWNSAGGLPNNLDGLIAAFGRPNGNQHDGDSIASPFVLGAHTGQGHHSPCSYFAAVTPADTTIAPLPDNSWIMYLGSIKQNGPGRTAGRCPGGHCSYAFIVGAGFWQGPNLYTYGHDPIIIVSGGGKP